MHILLVSFWKQFPQSQGPQKRGSEMCFEPLQRPIGHIFVRRQPLLWLYGTATLRISFWPIFFYRQGAEYDLYYRYLNLQFQCHIVSKLVSLKRIFFATLSGLGWPEVKPRSVTGSFLKNGFQPTISQTQFFQHCKT